MSAESKYFAILSAAAKSALPVHACALMLSDGRPLMNHCYMHEVEPEQETTE